MSDRIARGDDTHVCPRRGCTRRVPPQKLMCSPCWAAVPGDIGREVYRAWDHGLGAGTEEHLHAMEAAITAANERLGA